MPNRILRASLRQSRRWNKLSEPAQLFFIRLFMVVDDYGRYEAHPQLLASELYPYGDSQGKPVSCQSIDSHLTSICQAGMATVYEDKNGENRYVQLLRWKERVRTESKFPAPNDSQMTVKCQSFDKQMIASPPSPSPSPSPIPKAKPPANSLPDVPASLASPEFNAIWDDWIQDRRERHKPLTPMAARKQFTFLETLSVPDRIASLNQSMQNQWQGLFNPNNGTQHANSKPNPAYPRTREENPRNFAVCPSNTDYAAAARRKSPSVDLPVAPTPNPKPPQASLS